MFIWRRVFKGLVYDVRSSVKFINITSFFLPLFLHKRQFFFLEQTTIFMENDLQTIYVKKVY